MINDSRDEYGRVSQFFHWLMTFLIGWQLLKLGDRIADGEHWIGQTLVPWHISIGSVLLVLIVLRSLWALRQLNQRPVQDPATAVLVKTVHVALYVGMLLMPVTGILYMIGNGYGLEVFGTRLVEEGPEVAWAATLGSLHSPLAWTLVVLIIGHIGATLFHVFVKRDDILQRMV